MTYNEIQCELAIDTFKNGNKYVIELYNTETKALIKREAKTLSEASRLYNELTEMLINWYDEQYKRNFLINN